MTLILIARPAQASVIINEVAWMGGTVSANYEWIELYNSGDDSVVLDGWILGDGMNLSINLSGIIAAKQYAVLERSTDESAPGAAFLIYSGALVNSGATLVLRDSSGTVKDQVVGGENWQNIGGNNITKETAQYTTSGWVTGIATPVSTNVVNNNIVSVNTNTTTTIKKSSGNHTVLTGSTDSVNLNIFDDVVKLDLDIQKIAYVNQLITYKATAGELDERSQSSVNYEWNFGDTYTDIGRKVEHIYKYPGNYIVTVYAKYGKKEKIARHNITVLPVNFSISVNEAGDTLIHNDADYDVDLSGYVVRGVKSITMPPRTIISPKATLTIEANRLGKQKDSLIALYDNNNSIVASTFDNSFSSFVPTLAASPKIINTYPSIVYEPKSVVVSNQIQTIKPTLQTEPNNIFGFLPEIAEASVADITYEPDIKKEPSLEEKIPITVPSEPNRWPYIAFIVIMLLGLGGIFATKNKA